ncbi:Gram-positive signal peptide protein, YSIRK family [Lactobacillus jensenii 115-3-CHN]|nr:Gram-positive signal peptide protein, YSIRK family [Lactobacillus jensenii 115-3-CHN]
MRNMFDAKQRFSLRKLSIGVVSVLLGFTFVSNAQVVQADTSSSTANSQNGGGEIGLLIHNRQVLHLLQQIQVIQMK